MFINKKLKQSFSAVLDHVTNTYNQVICSGAATIVIHNNHVVLEEYLGHQSIANGARPVQEDTQFHVASVRKSYIGFAVAYAVYSGCIVNIDDLVLTYKPDLDHNVWKDTSIRHLLTHTHGLNEKEGITYREYPPGENWTYRQIGIKTLTDIVESTTGMTVSDILHEHVFKPLHFTESNWYSKKHEKLAEVILKYDQERNWQISNSTKDDTMNMYVSARELAYWGYLHLNEGTIEGEQIVPTKIISLATELQSPSHLDDNLPQNGFLWFIKDLPALKTEIGEDVPIGSYQILGYTGVTLLVIPQENIVAVRMFNSFGSPEGYDYLADVRSFGDTVMGCLEKGKR
ncbi:class A beta-lactamase-related serine hydrolase [Sporosarcina sp. BI001-red]|uniref:serine hydrolase domain-containing protein n=1 Tax=Sporosarcina sp. BI001-red TaxID=2282866 RepID=UPI000E23E502|nr:serine hydrolase domain-containing protein [Sporosarcina sp. BI001-red]REB06078.1 class A beta-lactamase-related serine hydrolase [Sporosarcina sp. BI001-red]